VTLPRNRALLLVVLLLLASCDGDKSSRAATDTAQDTQAATDTTPADLTAPADSADDLPETAEDNAEDNAAEVQEDVAIALPAQCSTASAPGLVACVQQARYEADLLTVASTPRPPGSAQWQLVQDLCATTFEQAGFSVTREAFTYDGRDGVNVIGTLVGQSLPDEKVYVSAHYDHITSCLGADDNGSGLAGLLETARVLGGGHYDRTLVVVCWDLEEAGLLGSAAHVTALHEANERVVASFVYEMIGYTDSAPNSQALPPGFGLLFAEAVAKLEDNQMRGDFIALIGNTSGSDAGQTLNLYADALTLPAQFLAVSDALLSSGAVGDLLRSDHAPFWLAGYPGLLITDTANLRNPHYHCGVGEDSIDTLDPVFAARVLGATLGAAATQLGVR